MIPKFRGRIEKGKFLPERLDGFKLWLDTLEGEVVETTVRKPKKDRSSRQNKYYWAVPVKILSDVTGYSDEEIHDALKFKFLTDHSEKLPKVKSTASLTTSEFESYLAQVRMWASQEGWYIPDPNGPDCPDY